MPSDIPPGTIAGPVFLFVCLLVILICFLGYHIRKAMVARWEKNGGVRCAKCGRKCEPRTATGGYGVLDPIGKIVHTLCVFCFEELALKK